MNGARHRSLQTLVHWRKDGTDEAVKGRRLGDLTREFCRLSRWQRWANSGEASGLASSVYAGDMRVVCRASVSFVKHFCCSNTSAARIPTLAGLAWMIMKGKERAVKVIADSQEGFGRGAGRCAGRGAGGWDGMEGRHTNF